MNQHATRLSQLRNAMAEQKIDLCVLPLADAYLSEYLPAHEARLAWLNGFSGSAGFALIQQNRADFFTDSRYTLQATTELAGSGFTLHDSLKNPPLEFLTKQLQAGQIVAYDPALHALSSRDKLKAACEQAGAVLRAISPHPIDALWQDRPAASQAACFFLPPEISGEEHSEKLERLAQKLRSQNIKSALIADPASINWLLNMRGHDHEFTPILLAFALLDRDAKVSLFVRPGAVPSVIEKIWGEKVDVQREQDLLSALANFSGQRVLVDAKKTNAALHDALCAAGAEIVLGEDPCALPKAQKNASELSGIRRAHLQDGRALCRFFSWLSLQALGSLSECTAAKKLLAFRQQEPDFMMESFGTIAAFAANGAIIHYRPKQGEDLLLSTGVFLLDSGGQYACGGTTDVTRTLLLGTLERDELKTLRRHYTRVLQGHLALAAAQFPEGTSGAALDGLARAPLWQEGLNYEHGTGHGVGALLGVHEGPQGIGAYAAAVPLKPGMILSNEPGYYRTGLYGIRIENLLAVVPAEQPMQDKSQRLCFETLTLVPYAQSLIEITLLSDTERAQINAYHQRVWHSLCDTLDETERAWLKEATQEMVA